MIHVTLIFPHYAANQNAAKLTRAQKEEIARTLHTPDALPAELWTLPRLTEYIRAEFGGVYESDRSYSYSPSDWTKAPKLASSSGVMFLSAKRGMSVPGWPKRTLCWNSHGFSLAITCGNSS